MINYAALKKPGIKNIRGRNMYASNRNKKKKEEAFKIHTVHFTTLGVLKRKV
jgi:hypothetical protein